MVPETRLTGLIRSRSPPRRPADNLAVLPRSQPEPLGEDSLGWPSKVAGGGDAIADRVSEID
jgi:hypothetical protein